MVDRVKEVRELRPEAFKVELGATARSRCIREEQRAVVRARGGRRHQCACGEKILPAAIAEELVDADERRVLTFVTLGETAI